MAEQKKLFQDADSRLKGFLGSVTHPTLPVERTYCFKCGAPCGWTTIDSSKYLAPAHIVVTCDDCDAQIFSNADAAKAYGLEALPSWLFDAFGIIPERKETH